MRQAPAVDSSTAGASSSTTQDLAFHGASVSGKARQMDEKIARPRLVKSLAQLRRFTVQIHGRRLGRRDAEPGHLQIPNAFALEVIALLHAQDELGELLARHGPDDADVEQPVANARTRCDKRAAPGCPRVADGEEQEVVLESKARRFEQRTARLEPRE